MEPPQSASQSDEWMHDSLIDDEMQSFLGSLSFSQDNPDDIVRRDDGEIEAISISRLIADFTGDKPVRSYFVPKSTYFTLPHDPSPIFKHLWLTFFTFLAPHHRKRNIDLLAICISILYHSPTIFIGAKKEVSEK
jgi:hypothetical protein